MRKWRLALTTLPWVALVLGLAFIRQDVLRVRALVDFGDIGPVLTGVALLIGLMVAGVITDFKESERLPADLATTLETIDDALVTAHGVTPFDVWAVRKRFYDLTLVIEAWMLNRVRPEECFQALRRLNGLVADVERAGASAVYIARLLAEHHNLRKTITRIDVIRRTKFIETGYALLDILLVTTLLLLIFSQFKNWQVQGLVLGTLSLIYIYLVRLIRDLDNPFDYDPARMERSAADVSTHPLTEYRQRLERALDQEMPLTAGHEVTA
ncbi:MAG: hypothetical protein QN178_16205 [Armatimonadota bacterium]|nr:hypothetical protein [Armatimonadota bacterium]